MQGGPHVETCPFAIPFVGTYIIAMGVMETQPLWHATIYKKIKSKGKDFEVLVKIGDSAT